MRYYFNYSFMYVSKNRKGIKIRIRLQEVIIPIVYFMALCNIRCRLHVTLGLHNRCSFWGHFPYVHSVPVYVFQNQNGALFSKIKKYSIWNILKKKLQKWSPKRPKVRLLSMLKNSNDLMHLQCLSNESFKLSLEDTGV